MRLTDYIEKFRSEIIAKVETSTRPLLPASELPPEIDATRRPYLAQHRVIEAARRTLDLQPAVFVIGEMGTGKTLIGSLIPKPGTRTIILCPGHLVGKWKSEIEKTVPNSSATILRSMKDCRSAANAPKIKNRSQYYILSKETGKLGYLWKPATFKNGRITRAEIYDRELKVFVKQLYRYEACPTCGEYLETTDSRGVETPILAASLSKSKKKCNHETLPRRYERDELGRKVEIVPERGNEPKLIRCGAPLWSADGTKNRKLALAEYLKRLGARFDYLILDEAHEFKSQDSAQANAFGTLVTCSKKTILLTGTIIGGYATHLYYLLWRVLPRPMKSRGYKYDNPNLFIEQFGVRETVTREYSGESSSNKRSKGSNKTSATAEKPGISPKLYTEFLLGSGIFLQLDDLGADLPLLTETPIAIRPNAEQYDAYKLLENQLRTAIAADLARGNKRLLGKLLVNLLAYPDKPFDLSAIDLNDGRFINPRNLSSSQIFPKEAELVEIATAAKARNSKTLIYCQFTSSRDIQPRLQEMLQAHGLKTAILRSAVKPELREDWIKDHNDVDALICNPEIVKTGLDLYDYTTIVFFQTGYNIFTLRQASRRSWRLGQTQPVNIYYLYYSDTMQARAIDLIARKLSAATALDGKLSADGLNALADEDDALLLARALIEGLAPPERTQLDAGQIMESIGYTGPAMIDTMLTIEPVPVPTPQHVAFTPAEKTGQIKDFEYYRQLKQVRMRNEKNGLKQTTFTTPARSQDQMSLFG